MKTSELLPSDSTARRLFFWRDNFTQEATKILGGPYDANWALAEACIEFFDEGIPPTDALYEELSYWDDDGEEIDNET